MELLGNLEHDSGVECNHKCQKHCEQRVRKVVDSLNLFVYGSLKPGELGYGQIEEYIESYSEAELRGYQLYLRDGLAVINEEINGETIEGVLLTVIPQVKNRFWKAVEDFEGNTNYRRLDDVEIFLKTGNVIGSVYVAKSIKKGGAVAMHGPWTTCLDPIFSQSFPLLYKKIAEAPTSFVAPEPPDFGAYWAQLNELLSQYLLLVSIFEHLTVIRFGGSMVQEPMVRIRKFQNSVAYKEAFATLIEKELIPKIKVRDSREVEDSYSTEKAEKAILSWYQVRSNLQHRGKSPTEAKMVRDACVGLSNLLLLYFRNEIDGIEHEWNKYLDVPLSFIQA
jgi:gamma-glutamylcyclotransferase (GGCT)/AIG2-like uncharacterized protein YtfP